MERPELDLTQDENIDAGPFAFKPYQLASLVDPKNLPALVKMGGVRGLLKGLGTHRKRGLSARSFEHESQSEHERLHGLLLHTGDGRPGAGSDTVGAGAGASQRHDPLPPGGDSEAVPGIMITSDDGRAEQAELEEVEEEEDSKFEESAAYNASIEERHRVFGENVLPIRKTKSLLQLMWLALKDKVLVSPPFKLASHFHFIPYTCATDGGKGTIC